jgi:signal transduction histidine kinase
VTRSSFRSIDREVIGGFGLAVALLLAVLGYARARVVAVDDATARIYHTYGVLEAIVEMKSRFGDARTAQREFLLTRDPRRLESSHASARSADSALARLRSLTADNRPQQHLVDTLQSLRRVIERLDETAAAVAPGSVVPDVRGDSATKALLAVSDRMASVERKLLARRMARHVRERRAARGAVLLGALAVLSLAVAAAIRVRSALAVRERAEHERDAHARILAMQSTELETRNQELMAQEEALREATAQAEDANRAKSLFLAQMSHELRTPLNSVIGFANIVRRNPSGALTPAELTYLERIADNGRQLLRTINSILDLSKIEAEQESVELELVALDALVREVLAQLEPQGSAGQVELVAELPVPLACIVSDSEKLRRVLINLVANALKFTRAGGRVVVRVQTALREPVTPIALEVHDTGIGIAPERMALIFEAFEQGDVGIGREYGGTGLGLSISRALCQLLRCELTVTSVLGEGSVFRIALPAAGALASLPSVSIASHDLSASR